MKSAFLGLVVLSGLALSGQGASQGPAGQQAGAGQTGKIKRPPMPSLADKKPVTCNEANKVFLQARKVLSLTLDVQFPAKSLVDPGSGPVSREKLVSEFSAILTAAEPSFKFTPNSEAYDPGRFKIASASKPALGKLVRLGFVGKVAPLATNPTDTMTVVQFGDALGLFLVQMAHVTQMPSTKFTPIISGQ